jgi:DNA-directed RNA polymerase subunit RPC12/RpoP
MSDRVSFRCGSCNARLKTSVRAIGRSGRCPRCGHTVTVRPSAPAEAGPLLVTDDGHPQRRRGPSWF